MGTGLRYYRRGFQTLLVFLTGLVAVPSLLGLGWRASHLPSSATSLALAGGGMALPEDVALTLVSPAHIWGLSGEAVEFGYLRMFGDLAGYTIRWQNTWRSKPLQVLLRSMAEEDIELRGDVPTAEPLGYFSARLLSGSLLRGWRIGKTHLGVGITFAYQRVFEYSARGLWFSAGWQGEPLPWLRWNVSIQNLGMGEALYRERDPVALRVGTGAAVKTPLKGSYLAVDVWCDEYEDLIPSLSWWSSGDALRLAAGIRWESPDPLLAAGVQLVWRRWIITYSYGYQNSTLGQPYMLSLSRRL